MSCILPFCDGGGADDGSGMGGEVGDVPETSEGVPARGRDESQSLLLCVSAFPEPKLDGMSSLLEKPCIELTRLPSHASRPPVALGKPEKVTIFVKEVD